MKKLLVALIIASFILVPVSAQAQGVNDFEILSFEADYYLSKNDEDIAELLIKEEIVANFENFAVNHGILRSLPQKYKGHGLDLRVISVTDEAGTTWPYTTYTENDNLVLKIGDANEFVNGLTTYVIEYKLKDVITFYDDYDELYWDTSGDQWFQEFGSIVARFHVPSDIELKGRPICFSGGFGSTDQNCKVEVVEDEDEDETIITVSGENLLAAQTISAVIGFEKDIFKPDPWPGLWRMIQTGMLLFPPLGIGIFMYRRWDSRGRDPMHISDSVPPQYEPPADLNVMSSSVVLNEKFETRIISAAIIEMAIAGYIKIYAVDKKKFFSKSQEYELELVKSGKDLADEQQEVLKAIFGKATAKGTKVNVSKLAYKLSATATSLGASLPKKMTEEGYFRASPSKVKNEYLLIVGVLAIVGVVLMFIGLTALGLGILAGALIVLGFVNAMPAKSIKGVQLKNHLLGQEDYMKMAEEDRINFLQSPKGAKEFSNTGDDKTKLNLYEKLLPYAMLFGIEKEWSKQFADLYEQPPEWLSSSHTFNAAYLSSALSGVSATSASAFTSPSSSGFSGGGGGGFSGGGGGGGGGGGW